MTNEVEITLTVNGKPFKASAEPRLLLSDFIRHTLRLAGTHVGCEHGVCGACTILVEGIAMRSCLMFAVQAQGLSITTVEGLSSGNDLSPLQAAFREAHALQCGYCTPGILMSMTAFLAETPDPDEAQIRDMLSGHLCRCTGYEHMVDAVLAVAKARKAEAGA